MTIRRGQPWGEAVPAPSDLVFVTRDAEASALIAAARATESAVPPLGLGGGDMAHTMGGGSSDRFASHQQVVRATVDVLRVHANGRSTVALAHVVARRHWWRGPLVFAMNAQFIGPYDVAPRSHPNDGKVDIVEVSAHMPLRTRLQAVRRARTGTHLPHPQITVRQRVEAHLTFPRPLTIYVDGEAWCDAQACTVEVEADAVIVHV